MELGWPRMATCSLMLLTTTQARGIDNADEVSQLQNVKSRTVELLAGGTGASSGRTRHRSRSSTSASIDFSARSVPSPRAGPVPAAAITATLVCWIAPSRPGQCPRALYGRDPAARELVLLADPHPGQARRHRTATRSRTPSGASVPPRGVAHIRVARHETERCQCRLGGTKPRLSGAVAGRCGAFAPPNASSPLCATAPMGVSERITVTCSMTTFHMPAPTAPVSPRRWPDFYAFHAEVETDTTRAVFTVPFTLACRTSTLRGNPYPLTCPATPIENLDAQRLEMIDVY